MYLHSCASIFVAMKNAWVKRWYAHSAYRDWGVRQSAAHFLALSHISATRHKTLTHKKHLFVHHPCWLMGYHSYFHRRRLLHITCAGMRLSCPGRKMNASAVAEFLGANVANGWGSAPLCWRQILPALTCHLCRSFLFSGDNKCGWHLNTNLNGHLQNRWWAFTTEGNGLYVLELSVMAPLPPVTENRVSLCWDTNCWQIKE